MPLRKGIINKIESAGHRVTAFRDAPESGEYGQLVVTTENVNAGENPIVTVSSPDAEGETEALHKLAPELGLTAIDQ